MNEDLWVDRKEAKIADGDDLVKDAHGITNPNVHRRVDNEGEVVTPELASRNYNLSIYGLNSYRGIDTVVHDEESTVSEIP